MGRFETTKHFLLECPQFSDIREGLFSRVQGVLGRPCIVTLNVLLGKPDLKISTSRLRKVSTLVAKFAIATRVRI